MRTLLAAAASLAFLSPVFAEPPPPTSAVIRNVTIIDVEAGRALPPTDVYLSDGRITAIGQPPADEPAATIDGAGLFLIPGLFDAHVHYVHPETYGPLMIANGVTFVRDLGGFTEPTIALRDQLNRGEILGPRMICTGAIIDGKEPIWPFSEECATPEQAREAVRKLKDAGVDQIKVYSKLQPDVYRAAIDETHKLGLKAVGHIPMACTVDDAVAAGQDCVEHLSRFETIVTKLLPDAADTRARGTWGELRAFAHLDRVDPDALRKHLEAVAAAGVVQCPTIVVLAGIGSMADGGAGGEGANPAEHPLLKYTPTDLRSFWETASYKNWAEQAAMVVAPMQRLTRGLHDAGATLMIGTDLANAYVFAGFSVHREMELWAEAGIPAPDILRAATITPARFCGVDADYGSVAPGKAASLVLLEANPLEDIRNCAKIREVFLDGRRFDRAALDALLAGVEKQVADAASSAGTVVKLELPGEVVARGSFVAKFGPYDAGGEEFLITRTADGYHLMAHNKPSGGFQKPSVITIHAGPDFVIRSCEFKELTDPPTGATYTIEGNTFTATPTKGQPQTLEAPPGSMFTTVSYATDFFLLGAMALEPGQSTTFTTVGFGFAQPAWRMGTAEAELTRHDDVEIEHAGAKVTARRYTSVTKTPMGPFRGETFTDAQGVPLKSSLTMPFGTVTMERK